jgi:hypothetical protein
MPIDIVHKVEISCKIAGAWNISAKKLSKLDE